MWRAVVCDAWVEVWCGGARLASRTTHAGALALSTWGGRLTEKKAKTLCGEGEIDCIRKNKEPEIRQTLAFNDHLALLDFYAISYGRHPDTTPRS